LKFLLFQFCNGKIYDDKECFGHDRMSEVQTQIFNHLGLTHGDVDERLLIPWVKQISANLLKYKVLCIRNFRVETVQDS
jgi:hypothetical protein